MSGSVAPLLTHDVIYPEAERFWVFLHGILGTKSNWRSLARKTVARLNQDMERLHWGAVLVDLRHHGDSQGFPAPDTLTAAASDVVQLCQTLPRPVTRLLGHSFGGKVALAMLSKPPRDLEQLWIIDSQPGARKVSEGDTTRTIFTMLAALPPTFSSRQDFVDAVVEHGHPKALAAWLSMNLRQSTPSADDSTSTWALPLDLPAMLRLLDDYDRQDFWDRLETPGAIDVHLVAGGRSDTLSPADCARLDNIRGVTLHTLREAGHWVHVDAAEDLIELLARVD